MKVKVVGIDLDGTITPYTFFNPDIPLPWWLFYLLAPLDFVSRPRKSVVEKMRLMVAQGYQFKVFTRRPQQFSRFTERRLTAHHVPFVRVFCVGIGRGANERKLKAIKEEKVDVFVDSSKAHCEFMKRNLINAVTSLEEIF
ncbi:MAG: hypothetical protein AAB577_00860 [Patescibacteria group bacterium]